MSENTFSAEFDFGEGFGRRARRRPDGRSWQGHGPGGWGDWGPGHRRGPPPWLAAIFGTPDPRQRGPRGPRAKRGDVRAAILDVLATEPLNGYQIIQQISERSGGVWKPSPGSVYPTMQQLEDEGLIEPDPMSKGKVMQLSEAGKAYVVEHPEELADVWRPFSEKPEDSGDFSALKPEVGKLMGAAWQILSNGSDAQRRAAAEVLVESRKKLYAILAEED